MTERPLYVADAVALARYLEDSLPTKAETVFREAESGRATILIPEIALGEFIYIALKGRLKTSDPRATIRELLSDVYETSFLKTVSMSEDSWDRFLEDSSIPELHDRMIHSIAMTHKANGIITNDESLQESGFQTIW